VIEVPAGRDPPQYGRLLPMGRTDRHHSVGSRELGARPAAVLPRRATLIEAVDEAAERWPDNVGWVFDDERVTFAQMRDRAREVATALVAYGVGRGDVVATWLGNTPEWTYCMFACSYLGALIAGFNTRWSADDARYVFRDSRAAVVLVRPRSAKLDFYAKLSDVGIAGVPESAPAGPEGSRPVIVPLRPAATSPGITPLDEFAGVDFAGPARAGVTPEDPALVQYTSGSTARPKGAVLSQLHVLNFGVDLTMRLGVGFQESIFNTQPIYHVGGSCSAIPVPLSLGCTVVTAEYYDTQSTLRLIEREGCVARTGMPTMYLREMQREDFRTYDQSRLRIGWTLAPPGVMDRIRREYPLELVQIYGSSEAGGTCGEPSDPWEVRRRSVGRAKTGVDLRIFDPDTGELCAPETTGEIRIRGWCRLLYYLGDDRPVDAIDADGWFRTGDLGWLDNDGRLYYAGRLKEVIRPGGENVSAQEVEEALSTHPAVKQVAVVGVPDPDLSEAVLAAIELQDGATVSESEVRDYVRRLLSGYKVPKYVRFVREMPLTDSGKIKKRDLQEYFAADFAAT
jgi:acyl-CoA synthetase (AMP-forming)/AMP-acid ligase II